VSSIPSVQTSVANQLTDFLYEKYDAKIDVESLSVSYDGRVVLEEVFIEDHHQDTLITAKEIRTMLKEQEQKRNWITHIPKFEYTTDNAAMIAIVGHYKFLQKDFTDSSISAKARYSI